MASQGQVQLMKAPTVGGVSQMIHYILRLMSIGDKFEAPTRRINGYGNPLLT